MTYLLVWFIFAAHTPTDQAIIDALIEKNQGNLLQAEGLLLGLEPKADHLSRVGRHLSEIALLIGNLESKIAFYESRLFEGRSQRGVALFVLAALHAHDGDFDRFADRAVTFLQEYPEDRSLNRYRLLYYLARFSPLAVGQLNLNDAETAWFDACRDLDEHRVFPAGDLPSVPFPLTHLHLLESDEPFSPPAVPADPIDFEIGYFVKLLTLKAALNREDDDRAAEAANALVRTERIELCFHERVWLYALLEELHRLRDDGDRAERAAARKRSLASLAILPFKAIPEAQQKRRADMEKPVPKPEESAKPATPTRLEVAEVKPGRITVGAADVRSALQMIESKLAQGALSEVESALKSVKPTVTYDRIYADYLQGVLWLRLGRYNSSYKTLNRAEETISDLPFPILESKILLALGDTFEREGNQQQAEWYRIAAAQIWSEPETIPLIEGEKEPLNPHLFLLDQNLRQATEQDVANALMYHNEMSHFIRIRQRAFRRGCLATNPIVGNQISEMGAVLAKTVFQIAKDKEHPVTPEQYNATLDVWHQLWTRVLPFYQACKTPSIADIQTLLGRTDRALALVEGRELLGALIISKTNAFAIGLGAKRGFQDMDPVNRLTFLEQRIGPIFQQTGDLWITASPAFLDWQFVRGILDKADNGDRVRWAFSFRSLFQEKTASSCLGTLVFSQDRGGAVYDYVQRLPRVGLDWFAEKAVSPSQMKKNAPIHAHFVFQGSITQTDEGLLLGQDEQAFYLHELFDHNHQLCSLTLVSKDFSEWAKALEEIELINVESPITIRLGASLNGFSPIVPIPNRTVIHLR